MFGKRHAWGIVDGDQEATAIIADRGEKAKHRGTITAVYNVIFLGAFIWYGATGLTWALAALILTAAFLIVKAEADRDFQSTTMIQIAERRIQLVEMDLNCVEDQLSRIEGKLDELLKRGPDTLGRGAA